MKNGAPENRGKRAGNQPFSGLPGAERRRFMDLGILPGTIITAEMVSPSGDPPPI
jgi:Fe2+ transport system protein FeoA